MSLALWICVAGVALGIIQLMVVLSVMSGFQKLLKDNYTRITSDIIVVPKPYRASETTDIRDRILGIKGVEATSPFILGAGMAVKQNRVSGVVLEGIEANTSDFVTPWESIWAEAPLLALQQKNPQWIWLGHQLAKKLKVKTGDTVHLLVPDSEGKKVVPFVVTALTKFGIYHHDLHQAYSDLEILKKNFEKSASNVMYKVKVKEGFTVEQTTEYLRETLGGIAAIKPWSEIHQNIFLAVEHQKKLLFLVLEIIVALAGMNLVNLLMMTSYQRKRDVAILRAMGMRFERIFWYFVAQGASIGMIGTVAGIVLGIAACYGVEKFQPALLSESVYNTTRLPVQIVFSDVVLISGAAFLLCILFSVIPALKVALSPPVDALRYE